VNEQGEGRVAGPRPPPTFPQPISQLISVKILQRRRSIFRLVPPWKNFTQSVNKGHFLPSLISVRNRNGNTQERAHVPRSPNSKQGNDFGF
jgi:hypothetical protein